MVLARLVAVLAVVCVGARGACGLSLEGVRAPHGPPRPLSLAPHRRLGPRDSDLLPDDQALALMPDPARYNAGELSELDEPHASYRLKHLISELAEAITAAEGLEGGAYGGALPVEVAEALAEAEGYEGAGHPLPVDVAEVLAEAEAESVMSGGMRGSWEGRDPRYLLFPGFLSRHGAEENNNNNNNNKNKRKARDNRNSRSVTNNNNNPNNNNNNNNNSLTPSTTTTTTNSGTSTTANNPRAIPHSAPMFKRAWQHSFSRRRNTGLSLSIDASMKVLREALYLEIARKKQRQQLQRAQHNKALLNTIGKRDVASQLVGVDQSVSLDNDRN